MLTCVFMCASMCVHVMVLAGNVHKLESLSERAGWVSWPGAGWEVDREMTGRKEKRWAPFHDGRTHQPISPGLLQERMQRMLPPERK